MSSLTPPEKAAGRSFRDRAEADLATTFQADPPDLVVPHFIALYRHSCPARKDISTALELKEMYLLSPAYPQHNVPAGRFGFLYRQGRCRLCGQTARSRTGRLVDAHERPPLHGRADHRLDPITP